MTTARTIIRRAMQKVGILTKTETPSSDEAQDGLDTLNDLIASVTNNSLMVYVRNVEQFSLTSGQSTYTIGPGADFDTSRPVAIVSAVARNGTVDYPLIKISDTSYDEDIGVKTISGIPDSYYYNNAYPTGSITLYPVPSSNYQLLLRTEKPMTTLTLDDELVLPPGWNNFLIYQLAVMLAPEYGQQIDPAIQELANISKDAIQLQVAKNRSMDRIPIGKAGGNIYMGWNNK